MSFSELLKISKNATLLRMSNALAVVIGFSRFMVLTLVLYGLGLLSVAVEWELSAAWLAYGLQFGKIFL